MLLSRISQTLFLSVCEILVYPTLHFFPTPAIRCTVKTPAGFARNPAMLAQPASNPFVQVFYSNPCLGGLIVDVEDGLNPFVQVFYSNGESMWEESSALYWVLIPLFRSFILIISKKWKLFECTEMVLIPLFRSFILMRNTRMET